LRTASLILQGAVGARQQALFVLPIRSFCTWINGLSPNFLGNWISDCGVTVDVTTVADLGPSLPLLKAPVRGFS
jgi:hypothetical protein